MVKISIIIICLISTHYMIIIDNPSISLFGLRLRSKFTNQLLDHERWAQKTFKGTKNTNKQLNLLKNHNIVRSL